MPAASGGLVLTFGVGAILGPLGAGWGMQVSGPATFWLALSVVFVAIALYSAYRMTRRPTPAAEDTDSYLGVLPTASPVAVEAAGVWSAEQGELDREGDD